MKYKDKVITGSLEQLLKNVILNTNKYYTSEFKKVKNAFQNLRANDRQLVSLNNQLVSLYNTSIPYYDKATTQFKNDCQQNLKDSYQMTKAIRSYSIAIVVLLMFIISIILFNFTRMAFEYEKQLTDAKEKISQNLNFKNRIIGMISHEIRSPLSIIAIYSKKISNSIKDNAIKDTFKSIEFTTNSLLLLSNQIIEYSKNTNHQLTLKNKNFFLKTELVQIITAMSSLVESHGNKIEFNSNLDTDTEVCTDVAKIYQLFYNIIGNANKFTENGCIHVSVYQENLSDFEINLNVSIQDNGIGINENELNHIFDSYYQGTVSEKVNHLGVGLGLNLCREIVTLFEGTISVASKENKGTTVVFNLILSRV
jgi:signal transduction histidine kinase